LTTNSTMYCSDCHQSANPTDPAGPHGSADPFILSGAWTQQTGQPGTSNDLCFKCHDYNVYANPANVDNPAQTGFSGDGKNLHALIVGQMGKACVDCHSAVPHGMDRPALLAYNSDGAPYANRGADGLQQVFTWQSPGNWTKPSCGTTGGCH
jgi:hypothetical protein